MPQVIDVFIASPQDVGEERQLTEEAVRNVSDRVRDVLGIILEPVSWTNFLPIAVRCGDEVVQDRLSAMARKCKIFVGILGERYGTKIGGGRDISGTEEEFKTALDRRDRIEILTYFKELPPTLQNDPELVRQAARLNLLKDKLQAAGIVPSFFQGPADFSKRIALDLFQAVTRLAVKSDIREHYRRFFLLGAERQLQTPSVLLAYPAMHEYVVQEPQRHLKAGKKKHLQARTLSFDWQDRLLPSVVYEDFKCIQKVETAIRYTGAVDISSVTTDQPRLEQRDGNRIWLCLPRSDRAKQHLARLGSRPRFHLERDEGASRAHFVWQGPGGDPVSVRSPLRDYLDAQKRPAEAPWDRKYGEIVARDYAVLARFKLKGAVHSPHDEHFYHYYIAGLRGLGTWGVGWYIDRHPEELGRLVTESKRPEGDVQALLEVTFANYRIKSVRDVSHKPQKYFDKQLRMKKIKSVVEGFA